MIDKITKSVVGIFFVLLPLFFIPISNTSTDFDKQIILVLFSGILFILLALKAIVNKKISLVRTPMDILFLILPIIYIISTILFAPNKVVSLTSPFGTATIIAISLLYFSFSQMKGEAELYASLTKKFYLFTFSGAVASAIYLLGQLKIIPLFTPTGGTLPAFAFSLLLVIFLVSELVLSKLQKKAKEEKRADKLRLETILKTASFVILLVALAVNGYHLLTDQRPLLLPFPLGWAIMMEMYKSIQNFLLGIGPVNYSVAYSVAKPAAINSTPFWNIVTQNSTSYVLTLATEAGIIAAGIYIMILGKTLKFRSMSSYQASSNSYLLPLIVSLVLLFVLPTSILLLTLTVILLSFAAPKIKEKEINLPSFGIYSAIAVVLLLTGGILFVSKIYAGNVAFRQAISSANNQKLDESMKSVQQAINLDPGNDQNFSLASNLSLAMAQSIMGDEKNKNSSESAKLVSTLVQQALVGAQTATQLNSLNSQNWGQLANIYQNMTGMLQGQEAQTAAQSALQAYDRQIALDATSPLPKVSAGQFLMSFQQFDQAQNLFVQAINLKPDLNTAHYNLAVLLAQTKRYKDSAAELQKTLDLTDPKSDDAKKIQSELEQVTSLIPPEATPSGQQGPSPTPKKTTAKPPAPTE